MNRSSTITGSYNDSNNTIHGFLRSAKGTITNFDAPGAGKAADQGTFVQAINDSGVIAGTYFDSSGIAHGFIRK
jgi:hypothetical protein